MTTEKRILISLPEWHSSILALKRSTRLVTVTGEQAGGYRPVDIKCTDKQRYCEAFDEYRNSGSTEAMKALLVEYELTELEEYVTIVEQA